MRVVVVKGERTFIGVFKDTNEYTNFFFIDTDIYFFGDCFLLLINFHLPATTTTITNPLSTFLLYES